MEIADEILNAKAIKLGYARWYRSCAYYIECQLCWWRTKQGMGDDLDIYEHKLMHLKEYGLMSFI